MAAYNQNVESLCKIEQDLALGTDARYEKVKEPMRDIVPILLDEKLNPMDKVRIVLLYIIHKGGITKDNLTKLINYANLDAQHKQIIESFNKLGLPLYEGSVAQANEV